MVAGGRGRRHRRQSTGRMPSWRRRSGRELGLRLIRFRLDFRAGGLQHKRRRLFV